MEIDIVEALTIMAELEKSGLVQLESSGDLILKELGRAHKIPSSESVSD